jgi:hypothetical protein
MAQAVENDGAEAKLSKLKSLLDEEGFFAERDKRLLIFTEFKDTLDYLVGKLKGMGFDVGTIHGGMQIGSREQPGTRLFAEQQFKEGGIRRAARRTDYGAPPRHRRHRAPRLRLGSATPPAYITKHCTHGSR